MEKSLNYSENEGDDTDYDDEYDSESSSNGDDPTYEITQSCSKLSIRTSTNDEGAESGDDDPEVKIPSLNEKDEKAYSKVLKLIEEGKLDKLKVDECKLYLKKHGLRLTGKKAVLLERIEEHLQIKDGNGENKYPTSSFVLDCKGDACTGDIVMFEQKVYENYSIASRSATGPPVGTRFVVGRIVKESYGAAKQQHTFTIEVLWSKGEKPLPPLHPLLIKGRNLYRLKTMRQPWPDEEHRKKALQEKHSRGSLARRARDVRVQTKEVFRSYKSRHVGKEAVSTSNENVDKQFDKKTFEGKSHSTAKSMPPLLHEQGKPCANASSKFMTTNRREIFSNVQSEIVGRIDPTDQQSYARRGMLKDKKMQSSHTGSSNCYDKYSQGFVGNARPMESLPETRTVYLKDGSAVYITPIYESSNMKHVHEDGFLGARSIADARNRGLCRHFLRGNCYYGERCKFVHDSSMRMYNQDQNQLRIQSKENYAPGSYRHC